MQKKNMINSTNIFDFESYYDSEPLSKARAVISNNYNIDSNHSLNYSSFLGDKEDQCYMDLLRILVQDSDFIEIEKEFRGKENLFTNFEELYDAKKCEYLIKAFFIMKTQREEVVNEFKKLNSQISKIKEAQDEYYSEKMAELKEQSYQKELKIQELLAQVQSLKTKREKSGPNDEKLKKYKKKVSELDKKIMGYISERKEIEEKYRADVLDEIKKYTHLKEEFERLEAKEGETEHQKEELENQKKELQAAYESLTQELNEIKERNSKLEGLLKIKHGSNAFESVNGMGLDQLVVTDTVNEEKNVQEATPETISVQIDLKGFTNKTPQTPQLRMTHSSPFVIPQRSQDSSTRTQIIKQFALNPIETKDPNRQIFFGDECEEEASIQEIPHEEGKEKEQAGVGTNGQNPMITTVHLYESGVSRQSESSIDINMMSNMSSNMNSYTENGTNLNSNFNMLLNISRGEDEEADNTFEAARKIIPKKFDEFDSNTIKF